MLGCRRRKTANMGAEAGLAAGWPRWRAGDRRDSPVSRRCLAGADVALPVPAGTMVPSGAVGDDVAWDGRGVGVRPGRGVGVRAARATGVTVGVWRGAGV